MSTITPEELQRRDDLWSVNPIITRSAAIDTPPARRVYALVRRRASRQRGSLVFWAHPLRGKTSIARLVIAKLEIEPRPFTVVYHEVPFKDARPPTEMDLLEDFLATLDSEATPERTLPARRKQVKKLLYALSAATGRLVLVLDEAQGLSPAELCWLKTQINWLASHRIAVTTVMFGQQELKALVAELIGSARSDLKERFMEDVYELENIANDEVEDILISLDARSTFPPGSDWTYTQFLWPYAFAAGFRLASQKGNLWSAFASFAKDTRTLKSLSMNVLIASIAEVADATKDRDCATLELTLDDWKAAVRASGYEGVTPTRETTRRRPGKSAT